MGEENKGTLTLYACRQNNSNLFNIVLEVFGQIAPRCAVVDETKMVFQFEDERMIQFSVMAEEEQVRAQAMGMANFFSQAPMENMQVKQMALQQMSMFNVIVGIVFDLGEDEDDQEVVDAIYEVADRMGGFVLYPDMSLYHSDGNLLISIEGETEFESFYPMMQGQLNPDAVMSEADQDREEHSKAILKEKGIPYIEHLRATALEDEVQLRSKEEIIGRLIATFAACIQAEVYTSGQFDDPKGKMEEMLATLEQDYHVSKYLSDEEQDYLETADSEAHNQFGWRYECCAVFLWALSLMELQDPAGICSAGEIGHIIWNNHFDSLMEQATLRSKEEIMDMQDLVLRYDWACVDARVKGKTVAGLDSGVIYYWHYAMNWLLTVDGIDDWDEIQPNT